MSYSVANRNKRAVRLALFRLSILGPPLFSAASGEPVRFRTRKHFALLIRLALDPHRRITRESLIELLWPDVPAHHGRHSLAQAVSVLKGKVGREHLQVQKATLALNAGVVETDVAHLDACDVDVRGSLLEGFDIPGTAAFEHWKDEWRARLAPRIRDCLVKQMDAGRRTGNFAAVERAAQVLYDLEPLSEDAVRGLMEARAWAGDRTNALKIYNRFVAALEADLNAKPTADLTRIADLLRDGRSSGLRVRETATEPRRERRFEAETLIGREKEFAALYDTWVEARQRRPRVVVLTGDAGMGKTTLTNAFLSSCQMEGAVVARAQAYDAERDLPFAVLAELVRQLAVQRVISCADPEALSELGRISPAIFEAFPGVPKPMEWTAEATPIRLADALLKAVTAAGDETPLILVVDDIHAADNASAAILHSVIRRLGKTRVLFVFAGRSTELRHAAASFALTSDSTIAGLSAIELESISAEAAWRLVCRFLGEALANPLDSPCKRILRAGGGNPLAIELLSREWAAHGPQSLLQDLEALDTLPAPNLGIPRAITAVFEKHVLRLDSNTRSVLDIAAVLGRRLGHLSLYSAIGNSAAGAAEGLKHLVDEGFLRVVQGELEFRNELIRAQAYYSVTAPLRSDMHRRVAELLKTGDSTREWLLDLEIAWHYMRGGDPAKAIEPALSGSLAAIAAGAPYEAERVLDPLSISAVSPDQRDKIDFLLCRALLDQSKAQKAVALLDRVLKSNRLSPRDLADAHRMKVAAEYLLNREMGKQCCAAADSALAAARTTHDDRLVAQALFEYARAGGEFGREERVRDAQAELLRLAEKPSNQGDHVVLHALAYCSFFFFDVEAAARYLERAIEILSASSESGMLNHIYNGYGCCKYHMCDFESANAAYSTALGLAEKMGDDSRSSIIASNISALRVSRGDYAGAIEIGLYSIEKGRQARSQPRAFASYANLGEAYFLSGEIERGRECIDAALKLGVEESSWRARVSSSTYLVNLTLLAGENSVAIDHLRALECLVDGRASAAPDLGLLTRLRVYGAGLEKGPAEALTLARVACKAFKGRNLWYYLDAIAAQAWAERKAVGTVSAETISDLGLFDRLGLLGTKTMLVAQGFLA